MYPSVYVLVCVCVGETAQKRKKEIVQGRGKLLFNHKAPTHYC